MKCFACVLFFLSVLSTVSLVESGSFEVRFVACRRLTVSDLLFDECANEFFMLSLHIRGPHVAFAAIPSCEESLDREACEAKCPGLVMHAIETKIAGKNSIIEKQLLQIHEDLGELDEGLPLGSFFLDDLIQAYTNAEVGSNAIYSLYSNNCASLLINMGGELGIDARSPKIIKFVSGKLSDQATPLLMEELTKDDFAMSLIEAHNGDEEAVIEDFVSNYIHARV